jgi:lysophospholipid acyltransferase (LPLAT)-like uncharacterized protein
MEARALKPPRPETELSRSSRYVWGGALAALAMRLWGATLRVEWELPESVRALERSGHHMIHAFWHAHILTLAYTHRRRGIVVLVSRHGDGEWISQIIHRLGFGTVRGSSHRGGLKALLKMGEFGRKGHPLSVTPDGPRGPRHVLQPGVLLIAQKAGIPIVPFAVGAHPCRTLASWDRFQLPHFFSRVLVVAGEPIRVPVSLPPPDLTRAWGPVVEDALRRVEARAEEWTRRHEAGNLSRPGTRRPGESGC